jgi:hypothetical protein
VDPDDVVLAWFLSLDPLDPQAATTIAAATKVAVNEMRPRRRRLVGAATGATILNDLWLLTFTGIAASSLSVVMTLVIHRSVPASAADDERLLFLAGLKVEG